MRNVCYLVFDRHDPFELPIAVLDSVADLARFVGWPLKSKKDRKRLSNAIYTGVCYPYYRIERIPLIT